MEIFEIAGLATIIFGLITTPGLFVSAKNDEIETNRERRNLRDI